MISVVTCTIRDNMLDNVFENFNHQLFEEKELIIILNKDSMDINLWKSRAAQHNNVKVFKLDEKITPGSCMNFAVQQAKYEIIAKFDDDDYYSPFYLKAQIKALFDTNADVIGKRDCYYFLESEGILVKTNFNKENQYVDRVTDSSLMIRKRLFETIQYPSMPRGCDSKFQQLCLNSGYTIFSTDCNNFAVLRRENKATHTWDISDSTLKRIFTVIGECDDYKKYVTKEIK